MTAPAPAPATVSRPRPGRSRGWAVAGLLVLVGHLVALYWPRVTVEGPVSWTDKLVHPVLFLVPLVVWSLWWGRWRPVAALLVVHAALSEVVQHTLLPHRSGDPLDTVADLVGVALGLVLVVPLLRRRRAERASAPAVVAARRGPIR